MGTGWSNTWFGQERTMTWQQRFVWWPRRSEVSNQRIWLCRAWQGIRLITGPGEPIEITHWMTDEEYVWLQLTNP